MSGGDFWKRAPPTAAVLQRALPSATIRSEKLPGLLSFLPVPVHSLSLSSPYSWPIWREMTVNNTPPVKKTQPNTTFRMRMQRRLPDGIFGGRPIIIFCADLVWMRCAHKLMDYHFANAALCSSPFDYACFSPPWLLFPRLSPWRQIYAYELKPWQGPLWRRLKINKTNAGKVRLCQYVSPDSVLYSHYIPIAQRWNLTQIDEMPVSLLWRKAN